MVFLLVRRSLITIGALLPNFLQGIRKADLMITTKKQLKEIIAEEKAFYLPKKMKLEWIMTSDNSVKIFKYLKNLRKAEFHYNNRKIPRISKCAG